MAVFVTAARSGDAPALLAAIQAAARQRLETWELIDERFVHTAESGQWNAGAYLAYNPGESTADRLVFYYHLEAGTQPHPHTYGVYNGRFTQMLLNHFSARIADIRVRDLRPRPSTRS
ncbi:hypothetical protein GCM10023185_36730 [Hymenobacter saemangeumensis]|uniref:Uncharacterized protein n=1 Tax=Hymenobacter saemangeumensis TaxID=1084522 RepID=A0ABP8IQ13_9BACT